MIEELLRPRGPYSLSLSARHAGDATRSFRDGAFLATLDVGGRVERAGARQRADGRVQLVAESEEGLERLRFVLALDDDHSPFLRLAAQDPLLRVAASRLAGLRPLRVGSVAHALLRALCGQLIEARQARAIERRIVRAASPAAADRCAPPTRSALGAFSPAELRALGLHARRGATLVRLCRSLDLERLRTLPTDVVAERLERERGLGPWSVGVICLQGLGRSERGLVGDLALVRLLSALRRRPVEGWETAELLQPYGDWAGPASVYLIAAYAKGLIQVPLAA
jgi:3-methyladenine DNA glycosylase/8-oxoguanine DNA glycosylase